MKLTSGSGVDRVTYWGEGRNGNGAKDERGPHSGGAGYHEGAENLGGLGLSP